MHSQCVPLFIRGLRAPIAKRLIEQFELPSSTAQLAEVSVSLKTLESFSEACAQAHGDALFGFHASIQVERGTWGLLEFVARHAPTLKDALERFARYCALLNELVSIEVTPLQAGRGLTLCHRVSGEPMAVGRHCNEYFVGAVVNTIRQMLGPSFHPLRVGFAHPAHAGASALRDWLKCPVVFDLGFNEIQISTSWLEQAIPQADAVLLRVLEQQAQHATAKRPQRVDRLSERVRERLPSALLEGGSLVERVATGLHMSGRTLQRHLQQEGVPFAALLENHRRTEGLRLLAQQQYPLGEVAYLLGYADMRSFSRACKRWTGFPPGTVRARQLKSTSRAHR